MNWNWYKFLDILGKLATLMSIFVGVISITVGVYALNLAMNTNSELIETKEPAKSNNEQITKSVEAASNALDYAEKVLELTERNSILIVSEAEITRKEAKETGENIISAINSGNSEIISAIDSGNNEIISAIDSGNSEIISAIDSGIREIIAGKNEIIVGTREIIAGKNAIVEAFNRGFQQLSNSLPNTLNQNSGGEHKNEQVDPTTYLDLPEDGENEQNSMYYFNNGALVLSYPENLDVYEILEAFSNEIGKSPTQNKTELVILSGNYDENHAQEIQAVTEIFQNMEIVAVPIREDSEAIVPIWKAVVQATGMANDSQPVLNADNKSKGNKSEVAYGSPLTIVFPK